MDSGESNLSGDDLSHVELENISMDKLSFKSFENTSLEKKYNEHSRMQAVKILRLYSIAPLIVFSFISTLILKVSVNSTPY